MKQIFRYITIIALALSALSCVSKIDPIFDGSADERVNQQIAHVEEVLMSSPNGWIVEYYPASDLYFGGFNMLLKFTEGRTVTAASELSGVQTTATSKYSLIHSAGCVLSFDTHNEVIHLFSDPESSVGYGAGYGYEGDFEFVVLESSEDVIRLRGRKTGNFMTMTPVSESIKWDEYLRAVRAKADELREYTRLKYVCDDLEVEARISERMLTLMEKDEEGKYVNSYYPFVITSQGMKFYTPIKVGNDSIEGLVLIPQMGDEAAFIPTNDSEGIFRPSYPSLSEYVMDKSWWFSYSDLSPKNQKLWDEVRVLLDAAGDELVHCHFGNVVNILGEFFAFKFLCKNAGNGYSYLALDLTILSETMLSLQFSEQGDWSGKEYYENFKFNALLTPLGNDVKKTFNLTADDIKDPQWIKFQDVNDPDNWFKVSRSMIYYPMEN